jgi:hypothetical protein
MLGPLLNVIKQCVQMLAASTTLRPRRTSTSLVRTCRPRSPIFVPATRAHTRATTFLHSSSGTISQACFGARCSLASRSHTPCTQLTHAPCDPPTPHKAVTSLLLSRELAHIQTARARRVLRQLLGARQHERARGPREHLARARQVARHRPQRAARARLREQRHVPRRLGRGRLHVRAAQGHPGRDVQLVPRDRPAGAQRRSLV